MENLTLAERIDALRTRGSEYKNQRELAGAIARNSGLAAEIKLLYYTLYGTTLTGCSNCIADAFFQIIKLKKEEIMQKQEQEYGLRAGALLHDVVNFDASKTVTNKNLTNELAVYHLATNPNCVKYFSVLPDDWQAQVEAYLKNAEAEIKTDKSVTNTAVEVMAET